jgi:hypothetical protein
MREEEPEALGASCVCDLANLAGSAAESAADLAEFASLLGLTAGSAANPREFANVLGLAAEARLIPGSSRTAPDISGFRGQPAQFARSPAQVLRRTRTLR